MPRLKKGKGDKVAILFQGEPEDDVVKLTYKEMLTLVSKFANVLKKKGVRKGDRVAIYLPMIWQLPVAMLACARIGAVHTIVFGGFSAEALRDRILDAGAKMLITANGYWRSGKNVSSKANADIACDLCAAQGHTVDKVVVVKRLDKFDVPMKAGRDTWFEEELAASDITDDCPAEMMDAEDPLFILYTSGSTGKPKGVLHTTGGYMTYVYATFKYIFDYKDKDIFFCTADIGWVTGHSYIVYGPMCNGATSIVFESVPTFPNPDRFWQIVEKFKVTTFYTAPTAIRALMKDGEKWPQGRDLSSLRLLGSVGEPINPEAWLWYHKYVGGEKMPHHRYLVADRDRRHPYYVRFPAHGRQKPGSASLPFFGVHARALQSRSSADQPAVDAPVNEQGELCIAQVMAWHDERRFRRTRKILQHLLCPAARLLLLRRRRKKGRRRLFLAHGPY